MADFSGIHKRSQEIYGGDWSTAAYFDALESTDEIARSKIMEQIVRYNREDIESTWAVFKWLALFATHPSRGKIV